MPLINGTQLGSYEIVAPLGAGGMGEVYRARDKKLGRSVALKVLPDSVATDPDRIARFEREAKALAALNHPHIAALFGMEESGPSTSSGQAAVRFLVMELVEGETLADRIARGSLAIEDALKIALQIAEAVEAAHEAGIVHRDLKPANVKITPGEMVKVLDFGLARAMDTAPTSGHLTNSPTLSMHATQAGVILGTAAYMSPEQAKGLQADARSDVFAFGVVFYEMLTGRQPFQGETAPDVLASVLVREADLAKLPPDLSPRIPELIKRCLEKSPKKRWQAVGDLRAELEAVAAAPRASAIPSRVAIEQPLWRRAIAVVVPLAIGGALTGSAMWYFQAPAAPPMVMRFPFMLPEGQQFTNTGRQLVAISPDGAQMVYVANQRLYLRSMADLEARPIPGTEITQGVLNPVFSPDGRSIAFWSAADQTLKRIAVTGGAAVTICPAATPFGMSWGTDGILVGQGSAGILRVAASGGKPELLVGVKNGEVAHGPQMLPGGQSVLFTVATGTGADQWDKAQIVVHSLRSGERKTLIEGGSDPRYLPTGQVVYALAGTLFAVPFDLRRLEVTGGPVPIVEGVRRASGAATGIAQFAFSTTGSLVYIPGPVSASSGRRDLAMLDRKGDVEPLKLPQGPYEVPRISPDGKRVAFGSDDGKEAIVYIYELSGTSSMRRLTFGGRNRFPIWSADGQRVAFQSDREGDLGIFWQLADGTGAAERLTKPDQGAAHVPESWSPIGDRFLFSATKDSNATLWTLSLQDRKAAPFGAVQASSSVPINSIFSPDGQWVTYASDAGAGVAGQRHVYVQPFPSTGAKYQISRDAGGHHPLWSPDGKELIYNENPTRAVVLSVTPQPTFTFGNPVPLPRGSIQWGAPGAIRPYDMTRDGRIVGTIDSGQTQAGTPTTPQIQIVLNWFEDLKARVP
jgi:serine/threonine-protein kinase